MVNLCLDLSAGNHIALMGDGFVDERLPQKGDVKSDDCLKIVDEFLSSRGLKIGDVDVITVCVGPGSFTGLRVGVTLAKGLSAVNPIKIAAVDGFALLRGTAAPVSKTDRNVYIINGFGDFYYVQVCGESKCVATAEVINVIEDAKQKGGRVVTSELVMRKLGLEDVVIATPQLLKVARELEKGGNFVDPDVLEPLYLRASQAEIEREKKLKGNK